MALRRSSPGGVAADSSTATDSTALAVPASQVRFAGWLPGLLVTGVLVHVPSPPACRSWMEAALVALGSVGRHDPGAGLPYSAGLAVQDPSGWRWLLPTFDDRPVAAAGLGQVRCTGRCGRTERRSRARCTGQAFAHP